MSLPGVRFSVRRLMVAVAFVAAIMAGAAALRGGDGSPLLGFATVVACVGWLTVVVASRADRPRPRPLRSLALAAVLIGVPDLAFVTYYWCRSGGSWSVVPFLHFPPDLNRAAVMEGAAVALGVAFLLRQALWSGDRHPAIRLGSISAVAPIVALLLAGSWLIPRRVDFEALARSHEVMESLYGGAPPGSTAGITSPDFPHDAGKAGYHRRMRERYEHAARYPWLSIEPGPAAPE